MGSQPEGAVHLPACKGQEGEPEGHWAPAASSGVRVLHPEGCQSPSLQRGGRDGTSQDEPQPPGALPSSHPQGQCRRVIHRPCCPPAAAGTPQPEGSSSLGDAALSHKHTGAVGVHQTLCWNHSSAFLSFVLDTISSHPHAHLFVAKSHSSCHFAFGLDVSLVITCSPSLSQNICWLLGAATSCPVSLPSSLKMSHTLI